MRCDVWLSVVRRESYTWKTFGFFLVARCDCDLATLEKKRTPIITITITLSSLTNNHVAENTGNHNAPFARPPVVPFAPSGPMAVW